MRKLNATRLLSLLFVPLFLLAGCTRRQVRATNTPDDEVVTVQVVNENASLVRIYVTAGSSQQWIGTVSAGQTERLTVPTLYLRGSAQVMFTAQAIQTGGTYSTPLMVVKPGNTLHLEVGSRLNFSTWNLQ
jgi:uncharacterized lipoprotein YajG